MAKLRILASQGSPKKWRLEDEHIDRYMMEHQNREKESVCQMNMRHATRNIWFVEVPDERQKLEDLISSRGLAPGWFEIEGGRLKGCKRREGTFMWLRKNQIDRFDIDAGPDQMANMRKFLRTEPSAIQVTAEIADHPEAQIILASWIPSGLRIVIYHRTNERPTGLMRVHYDEAQENIVFPLGLDAKTQWTKYLPH